MKKKQSTVDVPLRVSKSVRITPAAVAAAERAAVKQQATLCTVMSDVLEMAFLGKVQKRLPRGRPRLQKAEAVQP